MKNILIVDDEPDIIEFLQYNLKKNNYNVESVLNGKECIQKLKSFKPDIIILDIMMPKMNGVETCETIRKNPLYQDIIILFLSARNEGFTQIACYDAGGDDFIAKPIQPKLLIKKIEVFAKRAKKTNHEINGVHINKEKYHIIVHGKQLKLPKKQFELLSLLHSKPEKVFSRDEIINHVWGNEYYISSRNIDVQIRKIREQIGNEKIETIKGVGYKFCAE